MELNVHGVNSVTLRAVMSPFLLWRVECCTNCSTDQGVWARAVFPGTKEQDEEMKRTFQRSFGLADKGLFSTIFIQFSSKIPNPQSSYKNCNLP